MSDIPSRDVLLASVLRNLSRRETPMRYIAVERLRRVLFALSDVNYEEFYRRMVHFDPRNVDPKAKVAILNDISKHDDTGFGVAMGEAVFDSPELMGEAKRLLTELTTPIASHEGL